MTIYSHSEQQWVDTICNLITARSRWGSLLPHWSEPFEPYWQCKMGKGSLTFFNPLFGQTSMVHKQNTAATTYNVSFNWHSRGESWSPTSHLHEYVAGGGGGATKSLWKVHNRTWLQWRFTWAVGTCQLPHSNWHHAHSSSAGSLKWIPLWNTVG